MFARKIQKYIENYLKSNSNKVLIIDGARQVGKSFIIRQVGREIFDNYIEINCLEDSLKDRLFKNVKKTEDFYLKLSVFAGNNLGSKQKTLVFLDEIQTYPELLTLLKFLKQEDRFTYIASGSLLGVTLSQTSSIPMGSIEVSHMYPMDFEEYLWASGVNEQVISYLKQKFINRESLDEDLHNKFMDLFKKYLITGGLPDVIKSFLKEKNIVSVRKIQKEIHSYYGMDASKYDLEKKLKIKRIFDLIPSALENKKKRIVVQEIEQKKKRFSDYQNEFDYLINSGIALETKAISTPVFPIISSCSKNLLKLYLNDVGLFTAILFGNNSAAILDSDKGVNLGIVYENVVAQELKCHGCSLYYYDNNSKGEVDFLIDDFQSLSTVPLEVKSGKDYYVHSALNHFVQNDDYKIKNAFVLSNERKIETNGKVTYIPIYNVMFFGQTEYL